MKKQILSVGKALNKAEQKSINGGSHPNSCGGLFGECGPAYECQPIWNGTSLGLCIKIVKH